MSSRNVHTRTVSAPYACVCGLSCFAVWCRTGHSNYTRGSGSVLGSACSGCWFSRILCSLSLAFYGRWSIIPATLQNWHPSLLMCLCWPDTNTHYAQTLSPFQEATNATRPPPWFQSYPATMISRWSYRPPSKGGVWGAFGQAQLEQGWKLILLVIR